MIGRLRRWLARRAVERRIAGLGDAERKAIVDASPLEAAAFQGEGFHVFRKGVADLKEAYVTSLGEVDWRTAEDWIIAQSFADEDARRS